MRRTQKKTAQACPNMTVATDVKTAGGHLWQDLQLRLVSSGTITKLGSVYIEAIAAAAGITIVTGGLIVAVAMAGETTNSDVRLSSFIFSKTEYSTNVVCEACEPGWSTRGNLLMPLSQPVMR